MPRRIAIGLLIGVIAAVTPVGLLIVSAILWIPYSIFLAQKAGVRSSLAVSLPAVAIVALALAAPKSMDRRFGPFASNVVTLDELARERAIMSGEFSGERTVTLPSRHPTKREILAALKAEGELKTKVRFCAYAASCFSGSFASPILVMEVK